MRQNCVIIIIAMSANNIKFWKTNLFRDWFERTERFCLFEKISSFLLLHPPNGLFSRPK